MSDKERLLAYCGLYCGDCGGVTCEIADAAQNLVEVTQRNKFRLTAKTMFTAQLGDYRELAEKLKFMSQLRCATTCRDREEGACDIAKCCLEKGFFACHECDDLDTCDKFQIHRDLHGDSREVNLRAIKVRGVKDWIENGRRCWFKGDSNGEK